MLFVCEHCGGGVRGTMGWANRFGWVSDGQVCLGRALKGQTIDRKEARRGGEEQGIDVCMSV